MVDEDPEHAFEVTSIENQQPVETLGSDGPDEALRYRVRLRRPHWCLYGPDAFAVEDFVEGAAVLAVAVPDQEADTLVREVEAEVARLLRHPGAVWVGGAAGEADASVAVGDEEEHVVAAQEDALDREKIARDDARRLRSQELAPARSRTPVWVRRRRIVVGETRTPSLASSPQIRRWPQRGFSRASRNTSSRISADSGGRPRRPAGCRHFRRTSARCQRRSVRGVTRSKPRDERGRWHAAAASSARSTMPSFGRATCRRRISSSWRSTSSSMSFTCSPRRLRTSAPNRARTAR